jgi:hypothetical protein
LIIGGDTSKTYRIHQGQIGSIADPQARWVIPGTKTWFGAALPPKTLNPKAKPDKQETNLKKAVAKPFAELPPVC